MTFRSWYKILPLKLGLGPTFRKHWSKTCVITNNNKQMIEYFPRAPRWMLYMYYFVSHDSPVSPATIPQYLHPRKSERQDLSPKQSNDRAHEFSHLTFHIAVWQWYTEGHLQTCEAQTLYSLAQVQKRAHHSSFLCKMSLDEWEGSHCIIFRLGETSLLPASGPWKWMLLVRKPGDQRNPNDPEADYKLYRLPSLLTTC